MRTLTRLIAFAALLVLGGPLQAEELYGTLKKIKDRGEIAIGYREASVPFSYLNQAGEPEGYTIELCMRIVEAVKAELDAPELGVRMVPVTPQSRIPLLVESTIDMECGSTTSTLARLEDVDFSHITFITGTKLLVTKQSGVREVEDLADRPIAVTEGTTNEAAVRQALERQGVDVELLRVEDHAKGFLALRNGEVDAHSTDDVLLYGLIAGVDNAQDYAVVGRFLSYEPYAIMIRRDDSAFRLLVNKCLSNLYRSGEIFKIYQTWFGPIGVPINDLLQAAFAIQALPE